MDRSARRELDRAHGQFTARNEHFGHDHHGHQDAVRRPRLSRAKRVSRCRDGRRTRCRRSSRCAVLSIAASAPAARKARHVPGSSDVDCSGLAQWRSASQPRCRSLPKHAEPSRPSPEASQVPAGVAVETQRRIADRPRGLVAGRAGRRDQGHAATRTRVGVADAAVAEVVAVHARGVRREWARRIGRARRRSGHRPEDVAHHRPSLHDVSACAPLRLRVQGSPWPAWWLAAACGRHRLCWNCRRIRRRPCTHTRCPTDTTRLWLAGRARAATRQRRVAVGVTRAVRAAHAGFTGLGVAIEGLAARAVAERIGAVAGPEVVQALLPTFRRCSECGRPRSERGDRAARVLLALMRASKSLQPCSSVSTMRSVEKSSSASTHRNRRGSSGRPALRGTCRDQSRCPTRRCRRGSSCHPRSFAGATVAARLTGVAAALTRFAVVGAARARDRIVSYWAASHQQLKANQPRPSPRKPNPCCASIGDDRPIIRRPTGKNCAK